jgi:hypothetical protein
MRKVFVSCSVPWSCKRKVLLDRVQRNMEAGPNNSILALRVIGGTGPGSVTRSSCSWGIERLGPSRQVGGPESETVKYKSGDNSDPRVSALVKASNNCKPHTSPYFRDGAPNQENHNSLTIAKVWSLDPEWCLTTKIDWPTDRRS